MSANITFFMLLSLQGKQSGLIEERLHLSFDVCKLRLADRWPRHKNKTVISA